MRIRLLILLLLSVALAAGCNMSQQSTVSQPVEQISTAPPDITCNQLVTMATTTVGLVCNNLGRNQACYGNKLVTVDLKPNVNETFTKSGDLIDLLTIQRLQTSALNRANADWGIAVLKAQANLPDSLPGQNVTFLLFGDTSVNNPSPDMRAVTVQTAIGSLDCADAPESAVMIQSPTGSQVAMNINGADVTLGSTAYLTAQQGNQMEFSILEGQGVITANNITKVVMPGAKVGIPLGGTDGLHVAGPPSDPQPFDVNVIKLAPINLLDRKITIPDPIVPGQQPPAQAVNTPTPTPTTETACTPRTDWGFRYQIQVGDYLSAIALKLNIPTADLQAGNCITDPNRLIAGTYIRVPRPVATPVPPTATSAPTSVGMVGPNLRADKNPIGLRDCTTIRWDVDNISQVYFEGQGVTGHGSQQVCPGKTTTYTLLVIQLDGSRKTFPLTITIQAVCGNQICEPGESYSTCPSDCAG